MRPEHRMVAHTGFIVVARRVTEAAAIQVKSEKQVRQEAQQAEALQGEPES